ncbi:DmsC/YnfH family molybdoenzyme membrane anchor subunit [Thalassoglobus sp.]|uniref:DmsC/YnfH family molybdoenzyme membrane anchor subunit n=1 Tax=Thalassoglobus sp. TaxID=2795869 RepID=UPI003AA85B9D
METLHKPIQQPVNEPESQRDFADRFLAELLHEQHELTAVEEFSKPHSTCQTESQHYSKLLPATPPQPGQQYAFEVDLDSCSGCKSCVVACHSLNGLDEEETWRDVGLLIGGTRTNPVMQHVTTACHHCLEPACMIACPVNAYEKDETTGIVRHLDDQCFGCQYCTLACPYDVPKYQASKGIVRKCDMCTDRLSIGEAPACVQACPHEAIAIKLVEVNEVRENAEADPFLPGAPEPHLTYPTTIFKTKRIYPRNMLPADYYSVNPQHPHWPLIIMLVLTQLSVGTFTIGMLLESYLPEELLDAFRPFHSALALGLGLLALGASTLHLGRPQFAFRAILGLTHSWLSREIVAFGLFAVAAATYASSVWFNLLPVAWMVTLGWLTVATGALGLFCSIMIYVFTKREFWSFRQTTTKFTLTALILGLATTLLVLLISAGTEQNQIGNRLFESIVRPLSLALIAVTSVKLAYELSLLVHLLNHRTSPLKRSALLLVGPLSNSSFFRVAAGVLGGIVMPLFLLARENEAFSNDLPAMIMVFFVFLACLVGELAERYQFFAAVSAPRMPGGPRR